MEKTTAETVEALVLAVVVKMAAHRVTLDQEITEEQAESLDQI
jgi:hypothetical protein